MTKMIEIIPSRTKASTGAAMTMAGHVLTKTMPWPAYLVCTGIYFGFGLVILMAGMLMGIAFGALILERAPSWEVPVFVGLVSAAAILGIRTIYRLLGQASDRAILNRNARLHFNADGVLFANARSRWQTDWRDVDAIVISGGVVALVTGGIVLPALETDFPDDALAQVQAWHHDARL